jgi:hypothetical protein
MLKWPPGTMHTIHLQPWELIDGVVDFTRSRTQSGHLHAHNHVQNQQGLGYSMGTVLARCHMDILEQNACD